MSKSKYSWKRDNNYTKKLVTKSLSQTTYAFLDIEKIMTNYKILYLIFKYKLLNW
jgi:hypothetical protein